MSVLRTNLVQNITGSNLSLTAGGSNSTISLSSNSAAVTLKGNEFSAFQVEKIKIVSSAVNEIDTETGNLVLDSAGGTVDIQDNLTVSGNSSVTGNFSVSGTFTNYVIGTNVQAYDAGLTSIAGLSPAGADKLLYTTGNNTYDFATISTFARTVLDDADADTVCQTIGAVKTADVITVAKGGTGVTALSNLDVATLGSGSSTNTHVLTSDGNGGMSFQAASGGGGGVSQSVVDSTAITFAIALGG